MADMKASAPSPDEIRTAIAVVAHLGRMDDQWLDDSLATIAAAQDSSNVDPAKVAVCLGQMVVALRSAAGMGPDIGLWASIALPAVDDWAAEQ
jgi:hypothetical protein